MEDEKYVLKNTETRPIHTKAHWSEYAIKNVFPQVQENEELMKYLPNAMLKGKYPDRDFFWKVLSTILPVWSEEYIKCVVDQRRSKKPLPP